MHRGVSSVRDHHNLAYNAGGRVVQDDSATPAASADRMRQSWY